MKQSKYNFFYELNDGNFLAFNTLKNGLAVLDASTVKTIRDLETGNNPGFNTELTAELVKGGFINGDDFDEYGLLTIRRHMQQYPSNSFALTIAPTTACNLTCSYCYQSPDGKKMDQKAKKNVVGMVEKRIEKGLKKLSITWYGGESLLCWDTLEELSKEFISICEQNKVDYSAYIITNGTLYTPGTAEKLKQLKVSGAQITIDGDGPTHDQRRPYRGGKGSYDEIVTNVIKTTGIIPISLRVNVDIQNVDTVLDFFEGLRSDERLEPFFKNGMLRVHYGYVRKLTASCGCSHEECLMPGDFWKNELKLHRHLYEKGYGYNHYPDISTGCIATTTNGYVVGPRGELYKCWNHIGDEKKVVGQADTAVQPGALYISYLTESFEKDPNCRECKFLPICMGGCVDIRIMAKQGEFANLDCASWKFYLEESLRLYYLASMQKNKDKKK